MKTRKFTAMLLTLAMAFSLLTVSAGAVMDNDHDRISVDTAGPLSVVWDTETILLFTEPELTCVSSTIVRELLTFNKDISQFIPKGMKIS